MALSVSLRQFRRVPKRISEDEWMMVVDAMAGLEGPVSLDDITNRLVFPLPRRTLQRRLAGLVESGRVTATSTRGGRRYRFADGQRPVPARAGGDDEVLLSPAAKDIRGKVTRQARERKPVGYHAPFLDYYRPNASAYLSGDLRRKLQEMGRTSGSPLPPGTYFRKHLKRLLLDLSWNSGRLAGISHSPQETQRLLEYGEHADGRKSEEAQMLLNHKAAVEWLASHSEQTRFDRYTLCNLHALLADNLLHDPASCGRLRTHPLAMPGTVFHPLKIPALIETRFDQVLAKAAVIEDPFEQSFFALLHLSYLQPFESVNQRVARLAANLPFIRKNLIPLSFVDVPRGDYVHATLGVCELNRVDYLRDVFVWAYERSCIRYSAIRKALGEPDPIKLRHRQLLADVIHTIVRRGMDDLSAHGLVRERAEALPSEDERENFAEIIASELAALHEGNIARYQIRPDELESWKGGVRNAMPFSL